MQDTFSREINFDTSKLIVKYIAGTLSDSEAIELNKWLEDEKNALLFQKIISEDTMQQKIKAYKEITIDSHFESFVRRRNKQARQQKRRRLMIAAAIVLPVLFAINYYISIQPTARLAKIEKEIVILEGPTLTLADNSTIALEGVDQGAQNLGGDQINKSGDNTIDYSAAQVASPDISYNLLQIPASYQYHLILSDGTKVWLNAVSSLKYPVRFSKNERIVEASGEVYFEVKPDKKRPFLVNVNGVQIEVTGTSFNVNSYANNPYAQFTLVEGKINVHTPKGTIALTPGKQLNWQEKTMTSTIKTIRAEDYITWKDGIYQFKSHKLEEVLNVGERWFGVQFVFKNKSAKSTQYTGVMFKDETIEEFLNRLESTSKLKFTKKGNTVIIN